MLYVIFGFKFDILFEKLCENEYEPVENWHLENVFLGKDFNLGVIGFLFHAFTHVPYAIMMWLFWFHVQLNVYSPTYLMQNNVIILVTRAIKRI
jgi:hypothetical protein